MLKKYLMASVLGLSFVNQAHAQIDLLEDQIFAQMIEDLQERMTEEDFKALREIQESASKLDAIQEFTPLDIAVLDRLMDKSPARNILWGTYCEEQGESTVGLREENKQSLRLFMNRDAKFDTNLWSSDVHRPIGYSMPCICNPADNENAPTEVERRLKGQVCAKFFKAVYDPKYYRVEKCIEASEKLAARPHEGAEIYEEVFGEKYQYQSK